MAQQHLTTSFNCANINTLGNRSIQMAFNYRPLNVKEILGKKKANSEMVAIIYTFIKDTYGETIVLDPTTQFNKIKIPRIVEKTDNIVTVKQKLAKVADIKGLDISFGNGSGAGGSSINAAETAMQENATRFVCEQFIDGQPAKMPSGDKIAAIYPNYDDSWHDTFKMQAEKLKGWLGTNKGYEYSREASDGMMAFVERIALNKCGVSTKDSWNPADIYLCRKTKKAEIKKEMTRIGELGVPKPQKLDMLNDYMRKLFVTRDLIGVSLKKLGKSATLEESNVTKQQTLKDISIIANSIKLDLDLNVSGEFKTGEMSWKIKVGDNEVNVQIRAFSGGVREKTQMDMTGAGAAAKLGKVSVTEAINPFLNTLAPAQKLRSGTELPKVGAWTEETIKKYIDEYKDIKDVRIGGSPIDFGSDDWPTTFRNAIELEKGNNRTASQLSAKLQCFQWVKILRDIEKQGKLKEFLSIIYFGAKKEYASAGPFLKIS